MHLLRMIATHPVFSAQCEKAARYHQWYEFKCQMEDIGVEAKILAAHPFAVVCRMKHDKRVKYPALMIVMHVADTGLPWCGNLTAAADYKRVGNYSVTWGFNHEATMQLVRDGLNVEDSRETPPYR